MKAGEHECRRCRRVLLSGWSVPTEKPSAAEVAVAKRSPGGVASLTENQHTPERCSARIARLNIARLRRASKASAKRAQELESKGQERLF